MAVDVEVFATLLPPGGKRRQTIELERALTVRELAVSLGVDPEEVGLVVIDGLQCGLDAQVPAGGRVCLFPPLTGG